nr:oxidoreductase [Aerococcus mictus]
MARVALVTGGTRGIGLAISVALKAAGYQVAANYAGNDAAAAACAKEHGLKTYKWDVSDYDACVKGIAAVEAELGPVDVLVNNAGIAVSGPLLEINPDEFRKQMEVNVTGPLLVTQAFGPLLGADKSLKGAPGRIVMISSVGGKQAAPFVGPYSASKYALEGFSESLRRELLLFGIDVIIIGPGAVKTQIWAKAEEVDITPYSNSPYYPILKKFRDYFLASGKTGLAPEVLGRLILKVLTTRNPKVRYAILSGRLMNWTIPQLLPKRFLDRTIGKAIGLLPS